MFVPAVRYFKHLSATKMEFRCIKNLRNAFIAALCAICLAACSTQPRSRGDQPGRGDLQQPAMISPESCIEDGASSEAASLDSGGYRIQPGDQLAIDFYLNS